MHLKSVKWYENNQPCDLSHLWNWPLLAKYWGHLCFTNTSCFFSYQVDSFVERQNTISRDQGIGNSDELSKEPKGNASKGNFPYFYSSFLV